jgi:septin family protein
VDSWDSTVKLIDNLFEKHFGQVTLPTKRSTRDGRVHACLYFLPPSGRSLRPLDVAAMKELSTRVNLIPVIGKSDLMTRKDLLTYKQRVLISLFIETLTLYFGVDKRGVGNT